LTHYRADGSIVYIMTDTRVVHILREECDIYIGRGSPWGNPFKIGRDGDRPTVIEKYYEYIIKQPKLMKRLPELKGKVLGCHCKPQLCHGDVLKILIEAL